MLHSLFSLPPKTYWWASSCILSNQWLRRFHTVSACLRVIWQIYELCSSGSKCPENNRNSARCPRWRPLLVKSQASISATTHKIYLILFKEIKGFPLKVTWCRLVQIGAVLCNLAQIGAVWWDWGRLVQLGAVWCNLVEFDATWCNLTQSGADWRSLKQTLTVGHYKINRSQYPFILYLVTVGTTAAPALYVSWSVNGLLVCVDI